MPFPVGGKGATRTAELLHGQEKQVHADAGYTGVEKRTEIEALEREIDWQIAGKCGVIKAMAEGAKKEALKAMEKAKASVRAFVEHPFHIVKNCHSDRKAVQAPLYRALLGVAFGFGGESPAVTVQNSHTRLPIKQTFSVAC